MSDAERWLALGTGAPLIVGASRRSASGACLAVASGPLLYRGIPERIAHARGSAAHGFFECTKAIREFTRAALFAEVGKQDQYRHCGPILALGASEQLLKACGIETTLPDGQVDPGLIVASDLSAAADGFIAAIAKHRHFLRETDPPRV